MAAHLPRPPRDGAPLRSACRIPELDALRGIAALAVVLFHYTSSYDSQFGHLAALPDFEVGRRGVQLFFILSGFVIFMSLERTTGATQFLVARVARLYPTYWVGVLLTSVVLATVTLPGHPIDPGQLLANLTMAQQWFGGTNVDGVYWTLTVELASYALMLAAYRLRCLDRIEAMGGIVVIAVFALIVVDQANGFALRHYPAPRMLLGSVHLFFAGILLYRLPRHHSPRAVGLLAFCVMVEAFFNPATVLLVVASGAAIGLAAFRGIPLLRWRPLLFLGSISYPLYLLHNNIGFTIIRGLYALGIEHPLLILGVPIAAAIVLATAVHYAVEEPAQRWMRDRLRPPLRDRARPPAATAVLSRVA
jgi:peptidoglycan/LPS O-acetylase OafA/YrhL